MGIATWTIILERPEQATPAVPSDYGSMDALVECIRGECRTVQVSDASNVVPLAEETVHQRRWRRGYERRATIVSANWEISAQLSATVSEVSLEIEEEADASDRLESITALKALIHCFYATTPLRALAFPHLTDLQQRLDLIDVELVQRQAELGRSGRLLMLKFRAFWPAGLALLAAVMALLGASLSIDQHRFADDQQVDLQRPLIFKVVSTEIVGDRVRAVGTVEGQSEVATIDLDRERLISLLPDQEFTVFPRADGRFIERQMLGTITPMVSAWPLPMSLWTIAFFGLSAFYGYVLLATGFAAKERRIDARVGFVRRLPWGLLTLAFLGFMMWMDSSNAA